MRFRNGLGKRICADSSGFSLIEVMIAMGITIILAAGISQMMVSQNKAIRNLENMSDLQSIQTAVLESLTSGATCLDLLTNNSPGTVAFKAVDRLYSPMALAVNQQYGHIQISAISMQNRAIVSGTMVRGDLQIAATNPQALGGAPTRSISIPILASLDSADPNNGKIESCGPAGDLPTGMVTGDRCPAGCQRHWGQRIFSFTEIPVLPAGATIKSVSVQPGYYFDGDPHLSQCQLTATISGNRKTFSYTSTGCLNKVDYILWQAEY